MVMTLKERLYRFRSFWIFPIVASVLVHFSLRVEAKRSAGELFLLFLSGVLAWTLLEYGLHRFVFHVQIPLRNLRLRELVNASHLSHHASPRDPNKVLVQPLYGLVISAVLYGLIYAAFRSPLSATIIMTGIWTGFLYYEAVHYRVHFSLSPSGLIARQRRTHFYHHFTNNKRCFGVTSPLWDYVFGTTLSERTSP
jgi:sterol desaturase/sphingolipid hydroxylase (fatty acid hydroxylase superfamily)